MPSPSTSPSPMALSRSPTPSIFKRKPSPSFAPMPSAVSYLAAVSEADARARVVHSTTPASTPALSLSSSITSYSDDPMLDESDLDNADGLALPARPPTSEQVFTTA